MARNGHCIGPPGAVIHHERCEWERCDCPCHATEAVSELQEVCS